MPAGTTDNPCTTFHHPPRYFLCCLQVLQILQALHSITYPDTSSTACRYYIYSRYYIPSPTQVLPLMPGDTRDTPGTIFHHTPRYFLYCLHVLQILQALHSIKHPGTSSASCRYYSYSRYYIPPPTQILPLLPAGTTDTPGTIFHHTPRYFLYCLQVLQILQVLHYITHPDTSSTACRYYRYSWY